MRINSSMPFWQFFEIDFFLNEIHLVKANEACAKTRKPQMTHLSGQERKNEPVREIVICQKDIL